MLVLGIILILVAAGLLVTALFGGRGSEEPAGFDLGAIHVDVNTFTAFLAGAVTLLLLVAGIALIQSGLRRARRRRQQRKELNRLQKREETRAATPATGDTDTTETTRTTETRTDTAVTDRDRPTS
jgi:hypothetical protein